MRYRSDLVTVNGHASRVVRAPRGDVFLANPGDRRPGWERCAYLYARGDGGGPSLHVIVWAPGPIVDDATMEMALGYADPIADAYAMSRWPGTVVADSAAPVSRSWGPMTPRRDPVLEGTP